MSLSKLFEQPSIACFHAFEKYEILRHALKIFVSCIIAFCGKFFRTMLCTVSLPCAFLDVVYFIAVLISDGDTCCIVIGSTCAFLIFLFFRLIFLSVLLFTQ